jgi:hypothetical protein
MKKSDLKTGMWVEYRNGEKRMVALNTKEGDVLIGIEYGRALLSGFNENLEHKFHNSMGIVAIYQANCYGDILKEEKAKKIWERQEVIEMTLEEACKKLRDTMGKPVKITI